MGLSRSLQLDDPPPPQLSPEAFGWWGVFQVGQLDFSLQVDDLNWVSLTVASLEFSSLGNFWSTGGDPEPVAVTMISSFVVIWFECAPGVLRRARAGCQSRGLSRCVDRLWEAAASGSGSLLNTHTSEVFNRSFFNGESFEVTNWAGRAPGSGSGS